MVWTLRISAPFWRRSVAYEWRRVCGVTSFVMPAAWVYFWSSLWTDLGVRGVWSSEFLAPPGCLRSPVRLSWEINRYGLVSRRMSRYFLTHFLASSEVKTTRVLPPLPRTVNSSLLKLTFSTFKFTSSETRSPVEKSNSKIALSRYLISVSPGRASSGKLFIVRGA